MVTPTAIMLQQAAARGKLIKDHGTACKDCAFTKGTEANADEHATEAAAQALAMG